MKRIALALGLLGGAALLAGCSQVSALTPVGGAAITSVRNATIDVLVDQQVPILVAPQCAAESAGFVCTGTTIDGGEIVSRAQPTAPFALTITVAGETIFEGDAQSVLDAALLESS